MAPAAIHLSPHPDDEALGCPAALLHLRDRGWQVINVVSSLGFEHQQARRREEAEAAAALEESIPVFLDPPLGLSIGDDLGLAATRLSDALPGIVQQYGASIVVSPSPHDVHHGHEAVGRAVQQAMSALPPTTRWWMWGIWGDLPAPNVFYAFDQRAMDRALRVLEAYGGELERNDYRRLLTGRSSANAVLGSERVFGFGSPAASTLPYAEVITEVRLTDGRFMASEAHQLDEGPSPDTRFDVDLTAWVTAPSVHEMIGRIREVEADTPVGSSERSTQ